MPEMIIALGGTKKKRPSADLATPPQFGSPDPSFSPAGAYGGAETSAEESLETSPSGIPGELTCPDCGATYTLTKKEAPGMGMGMDMDAGAPDPGM